jgi:hypothetical protein
MPDGAAGNRAAQSSWSKGAVSVGTWISIARRLTGFAPVFRVASAIFVAQLPRYDTIFATCRELVYADAARSREVIG